MAADKPPNSRRRTLRRNQDMLLRQQLDRYAHLFRVGQLITSELDFDKVFDVIIEQTVSVMQAERCSIFLIDERRERLGVFASRDLSPGQFHIAKDQGIAGWVYSHQAPLIVNDVRKHPLFCQQADRVTGFRTRNMLCVPLISRSRQCMGTMQVLNKKQADFCGQDQELLTHISNYVAVALENAQLYEQLRASDRAKQKAIDHLSHEMKTPLAIISAVFDRVAHVLEDYDFMQLMKTLARGRRHVTRLLDLQGKVDDIMSRRVMDEAGSCIRLIEDTLDFLEELGEVADAGGRQVIQRVSDRIQSVIQINETHFEWIPLDAFLQSVCDRELSRAAGRHIDLQTAIEPGLRIHMDHHVLDKIFAGLLKNAIENTPDGGRVRVAGRAAANSIQVVFQDFGIGITAENQNNIFFGFFHTQDTALYSSKQPYAFNAGGSGADLLRIKTFSERYGFSIDFSSTRCCFIPDASDMCCGNLHTCEKIKSPGECLESGGTTFTLKFAAPAGAATCKQE